MRALCGLGLLACAPACLISAPEGELQLWPPPLGTTVQAVTAADLDGNGSTDVVVFGTGKSNQAGMYLISGGADIVPGTGKPVKTFTRFVPQPLGIPTAAAVTPGLAPRVITATGAPTVALETFTNTLAEDAEAATMINSVPQLWVRPLLFPGNQQRLAVSDGSTIQHASLDLSEVRLIPPPAGAPMWTMAQLATSYASGQDQVLVVATPTDIVRAPVPVGGGMPTFTWTSVRQGTGWLGQTTADLDGDGRDEIVGFDLATHSVCAVDPGSATVPATPACLPVGTTFPGTEVTIIAGVNISMNPGLDILIAQGTGSETSFTLVEDFSYAPGSLTATMSRPLGMGGPSHGRTVVVSGGPASPNTVLVFSTEGAITCLLGPC